MKKILFSGYYGKMNSGDDAFTFISSWLSLTHLHRLPVFTAAELPVTMLPAHALYRKRQHVRGENKLRLVYSLSRWRRLVFSGGSIFHGNEGEERDYIDLLSNHVPIRMGAIGVSIGPFADGAAERKVCAFLKKLSFLALRDRKSYDFARSLDLPYTPVHSFDLAGLLPLLYKNIGGEPDGDGRIGVIPCNYFGDRGMEGERERQIKWMSAMIDSLLSRTRCRIRFFVFNGSRACGDAEIVRALADRTDPARTEIVPYSAETETVFKKVAECRSVFAVRLHGAVFSLMAGTPFVLAEYHRKCTDFLDEIGYPDRLRIGCFDRAPAETADALIADSAAAFRDAVDLDAILARASLNMDEVKKIL